MVLLLGFPVIYNNERCSPSYKSNGDVCDLAISIQLTLPRHLPILPVSNFRILHNLHILVLHSCQLIGLRQILLTVLIEPFCIGWQKLLKSIIQDLCLVRIEGTNLFTILFLDYFS
jgi:hypothetical protein